MNRWAIYIDIQGFSSLWKNGDTALLALCELMRAIFRVGKSCYPKAPDRLFAHQFGDGFLIISDFEEKSLERCVTIAIALLRHVSVTGCFAKAAIIEGDMQGINGCYPDEVINHSDNNFNVSLGEGLMTIIPVMGSALIRGVRLEKNSPKGPLLVTEKEKIDRLPPCLSTSDAGEEVVSINWITYQSNLLSDIQQRANLESPSKAKLQELLLRYCMEHEKISKDWVQNVNKFLLS